MKILLANKFYYRRGGDCIVTMGLEELLKAHGHEVAVFAMDFPENVESQWRKYWPSNMSKVKAFTRPFGDGEVKAKFNQLLDDFRPDVVHLHNVHTQLSPVIAEIAHERGIKVFWTLHDTKLVCPSYNCMLNGKWCEQCFTDKIAVIKNRCMPGSIPGAVIGYLEQRKWNAERLQACTTKFLPPSQFMADTCIRGGYDANKFEVLCNFIDVNKVANPNFEKGRPPQSPCLGGSSEREQYYCYLGRVTEVKGIRTLCEAAKQLPYKLVVIGGGDILDELKAKYPDVEFLGQCNWDEFRPVLEGAKFMVLPSEWSENNPLTVIEAQSLGTPVLGARIGGIPELIEDGVSGMTFESGNVADLKEKIQKMWEAEFDYEKLSENAIQRYSSDSYIERLLEYYKGNK